MKVMYLVEVTVKVVEVSDIGEIMWLGGSIGTREVEKTTDRNRALKQMVDIAKEAKEWLKSTK